MSANASSLAPNEQSIHCNLAIQTTLTLERLLADQSAIDLE
ncbi:hypothetical protein [Candidatus Endolissoclinum faulkneri]|nr:hypothetical protein [Candidatus Endolissoclinum faulkneri]